MDLLTNEKTSVTSERVLYTPSSFARSSLLYLQETGTLQALNPHVSSRSLLGSYLFFQVLKGSGELVYDGDTYNLKSGDCVFIDCDKAYSHKTDEDLWQLTWCHFNGPEMKSIYDKYVSRGGKPVFESVLPYKEILAELYKEAASDTHLRDMKINAILSNLLIMLMEDAWNPESAAITEKQKQVIKVRSYIDENFASKITLDELSKMFFIDKFYLCEQFKERYGITVNDYINSVRITQAKKLLRFTDKTMEEIAELIGVNGAAYFSRMFKKIEGVSPNEYRKAW